MLQTERVCVSVNHDVTSAVSTPSVVSQVQTSSSSFQESITQHYVDWVWVTLCVSAVGFPPWAERGDVCHQSATASEIKAPPRLTSKAPTAANTSVAMQQPEASEVLLSDQPNALIACKVAEDVFNEHHIKVGVHRARTRITVHQGSQTGRELNAAFVKSSTALLDLLEADCSSWVSRLGNDTVLV